jgi:hypothetical protein
MGVRLYNPMTGLFLSTDPVYGGNPNTYAYPVNPITGYDLTGRWDIGGWITSHIDTIVMVASVVAVVASGPIGLIAAGVAIAGSAYMARRDFASGHVMDGLIDMVGCVAGVGEGVAALRVWRAARAAEGLAGYRGATQVLRNARGDWGRRIARLGLVRNRYHAANAVQPWRLDA